MAYRNGQKFVFVRRSYDLLLPEHSQGLMSGEQVQVIRLPGAPPPGTMGQYHIARMDGSFAGMVDRASLEPIDSSSAIQAQRKLLLSQDRITHVKVLKTKGRKLSDVASGKWFAPCHANFGMDSELWDLDVPVTEARKMPGLVSCPTCIRWLEESKR